jgi:hypothetical protein
MLNKKTVLISYKIRTVIFAPRFNPKGLSLDHLVRGMKMVILTLFFKKFDQVISCLEELLSMMNRDCKIFLEK